MGGVSSTAAAGRQSRPAHEIAAAFEQDDVVPDPVYMAVAFAGPDFAIPVSVEQSTTGCVGGKSLRLKCPVSLAFRKGEDPIQEGGPDALSNFVARDVDADLSDPGGSSRIRDGG
jgi:hypothetical protein